MAFILAIATLRFWIYAFALIAILFFIWPIWDTKSLVLWRYPFGSQANSESTSHSAAWALECPHADIADDVFLTLKTGSTEVHEKLPMHFLTTLRCVPHYAVYSDLEEIVHGYHVSDSLDEIAEEVKDRNAEFDFYRQVKDYRSRHQSILQLVKEDTKQAWNLDKWKFLPLMDKALKRMPNARWFVFVEADTAILWSNLMQWLSKLDPEKPLYIGGPAWANDEVFAHGGTAFIVSKPALQLLAEKRKSSPEYFDGLTADGWAGDVILAQAFRGVGVELTKAWPILQGETPPTLDYDKRKWCFPSVSYHHMSPSWILRLWDFEQAWLRDHGSNATILHSDVFGRFIQPNINSPVEKWNNLSPDDANIEYPIFPGDCENACRQNPDCVQYMYNDEECKTSNVIRLGEVDKFKDLTSGWLADRIEDFKAEKGGECKEDWITE